MTEKKITKLIKNTLEQISCGSCKNEHNLNVCQNCGLFYSLNKYTPSKEFLEKTVTEYMGMK